MSKNSLNIDLWSPHTQVCTYMLIPLYTDTQTHLEHRINETDKMTQWVKAFAVNPDSLSSVPRNSMVNGDNQTPHHGTGVPTHIQINRAKKRTFPNE